MRSILHPRRPLLVAAPGCALTAIPAPSNFAPGATNEVQVVATNVGNSTNICRSPQRATAKFTAQDGLVEDLGPLVRNSCKKQKGSKHRKGRGSRGHKGQGKRGGKR